jgi:L-amino acid N-acyltransferase YncA
MDTLMIRRSRVTDVPAIAEIYGNAVTHGTASFELSPPGQDEMRERWKTLVDANFPYFVADWAHRRGAGKALLNTLIQAGVEMGFRQMIAIIGDSAHQASIRLHESAGFTPAGNLRNVGFKHGRWLDSVLMQLSLGEGDTTPPTR